MSQLTVRFWGVRGSLATPGAKTARYGGNTSCVEVQAGDERIVFDMGSGLRELGAALRGTKDLRITFFLSHYHWDHILGLPFFAPAFDPTATLVIHGATRLGKSVREILAGQMINPYFPVGLGEMFASLQFRGVESGARVPVGDAVVTIRELNHPGGALGFRIDRGEHSVVYATDFEHGTSADDVLAELAQGADVLIYDATYTEHEYPRHVGWGHSTWAEGVRISKKAGVKRLVLFHHDPSHDDAAVDAIVRDAKKAFPDVCAACEGDVIVLGGPVRAVQPAASPKPAPRAKTATAKPRKAPAKVAAKAVPKRSTGRGGAKRPSTSTTRARAARKTDR